MADIREFMNRVAMEVMEEQSRLERLGNREVKSWRFTKQVVVNPDARCPWCGGWVSTRRVWVVDERQKRVLKVWEIGTGEKVSTTVTEANPYAHPHVFSGGSVCMGDSKTVTQALFAGLTPGDAIFPIWKWLEERGHGCEFVVEARRIEDEEMRAGARASERARRITAAREGYEDECECGECVWLRNEGLVEEPSRCECCGREVDSEDDLSDSNEREEKLCDDCWGGYYGDCNDCGESTYRDYLRDVLNEVQVCGRCWENNGYFTCDNCGESLGTDEYGGEGECQECWDKWHSLCEGCDEGFETKELVDGRCEDCQPDEDAEEEVEDDETETVGR